MYCKSSSIFLFFVFVLSCTYAQKNTYLKSMTIKDGLPSNLVYISVKDKNDYIWFSTDNGLTKFNGSSFKNFNKKNGLPTNDIFELNVDSKNRIWLDSYENGLYYIKNDTIKLVQNSLSSNGYRYLFEKSDTIFFGSNYSKQFYYSFGKKMFLYPKTSKTLEAAHLKRNIPFLLKKAKNKSNIPYKDINSITEDKYGQWIINKANELFYLKFIYINNNYINDFKSVGITHQINFLKDNICILNKNRELFLFDILSKKLTFIKSYPKNSTFLNILKTNHTFMISDESVKDIIEVNPYKLKTEKKKYKLL